MIYGYDMEIRGDYFEFAIPAQAGADMAVPGKVRRQRATPSWRIAGYGKV